MAHQAVLGPHRNTVGAPFSSCRMASPSGYPHSKGSTTRVAGVDAVKVNNEIRPL